jgi:hypothetical protein
MSIRDRAKGWARQHTEELRRDPQAWARAQGQRMKKMVDVAPLQRRGARARAPLAARADGPARRPRRRRAESGSLTSFLALHERLTTGGALVSGAKLGLAASVLPVVGLITGPLVGSAYGVYRSQKLGDVRRELQDMLRALAVG